MISTWFRTWPTNDSTWFRTWPTNDSIHCWCLDIAALQLKKGISPFVDLDVERFLRQFAVLIAPAQNTVPFWCTRHAHSSLDSIQLQQITQFAIAVCCSIIPFKTCFGQFSFRRYTCWMRPERLTSSSTGIFHTIGTYPQRKWLSQILWRCSVFAWAVAGSQPFLARLWAFAS